MSQGKIRMSEPDIGVIREKWHNVVIQGINIDLSNDWMLI